MSVLDHSGSSTGQTLPLCFSFMKTGTRATLMKRPASAQASLIKRPASRAHRGTPKKKPSQKRIDSISIKNNISIKLPSTSATVTPLPQHQRQHQEQQQQQVAVPQADCQSLLIAKRRSLRATPSGSEVTYPSLPGMCFQCKVCGRPHIDKKAVAGSEPELVCYCGSTQCFLLNART